MKAYGRAAGAAMGGVNILAVDTKPTVIEGAWHGDQTVVRWNSSRWTRLVRGTSPRPTRRRRSYVRPPPTATR